MSASPSGRMRLEALYENLLNQCAGPHSGSARGRSRRNRLENCQIKKRPDRHTGADLAIHEQATR